MPLEERFRSIRHPDGVLNFSFSFRRRLRMPVRIVLADDHVLVRQGLRSLLEREGFQSLGKPPMGRRLFVRWRRSSPISPYWISVCPP